MAAQAQGYQGQPSDYTHRTGYAPHGHDPSVDYFEVFNDALRFAHVRDRAERPITINRNSSPQQIKDASDALTAAIKNIPESPQKLQYLKGAAEAYWVELKPRLEAAGLVRATPYTIVPEYTATRDYLKMFNDALRYAKITDLGGHQVTITADSRGFGSSQQQINDAWSRLEVALEADQSVNGRAHFNAANEAYINVLRDHIKLGEYLRARIRVMQNDPTIKYEDVEAQRAALQSQRVRISPAYSAFDHPYGNRPGGNIAEYGPGRPIFFTNSAQGINRLSPTAVMSIGNAVFMAIPPLYYWRMHDILADKRNIELPQLAKGMTPAEQDHAAGFLTWTEIFQGFSTYSMTASSAVFLLVGVGVLTGGVGDLAIGLFYAGAGLGLAEFAQDLPLAQYEQMKGRAIERIVSDGTDTESDKYFENVIGSMQQARDRLNMRDEIAASLKKIPQPELFGARPDGTIDMLLRPDGISVQDVLLGRHPWPLDQDPKQCTRGGCQNYLQYLDQHMGQLSASEELLRQMLHRPDMIELLKRSPTDFMTSYNLALHDTLQTDQVNRDTLRHKLDADIPFLIKMKREIDEGVRQRRALGHKPMSQLEDHSPHPTQMASADASPIAALLGDINLAPPMAVASVSGHQGMPATQPAQPPTTRQIG